MNPTLTIDHDSPPGAWAHEIDIRGKQRSLPAFDGDPMRPIERIIDRVCAVTGFKPHEIKSARRPVGICRARFAISYIAYKTTESTYPQLGAAMGDRDHTTIQHQVTRAAKLMQTDDNFRALVKAAMQ